MRKPSIENERELNNKLYQCNNEAASDNNNSEKNGSSKWIKTKHDKFLPCSVSFPRQHNLKLNLCVQMKWHKLSLTFPSFFWSKSELRTGILQHVHICLINNSRAMKHIPFATLLKGAAAQDVWNYKIRQREKRETVLSVCTPNNPTFVASSFSRKNVVVLYHRAPRNTIHEILISNDPSMNEQQREKVLHFGCLETS